MLTKLIVQMYRLCTYTCLIILPQILKRGFNDKGNWEGTRRTYTRDAAKKKFLKIAEGGEETTGEEGEGKKSCKTAEVEEIKIQEYTLGKKMKRKAADEKCGKLGRRREKFGRNGRRKGKMRE